MNYETKLKQFFINNGLTADYVKYIDEDNFAFAFKEKEHAEKVWQRFGTHFNEILGFSQDVETNYWHLTKGEIK